METLEYCEEKGSKSFRSMEDAIAAHKQVEEKLKESQKFINRIVENSGDAIITTNFDKKITFWGKGAEDLFGYKSVDVLGKVIDFLYPEDLKDERNKWQKEILTGKTLKNIRTRIYNSCGELIDISLTLSPMIDENGHITGTIGISKDITDVIKAEKRLHEKIEELEKWQRLTIAREVRMVELKNRIKELEERLSLNKY